MRNPAWHRDEVILALDLYFTDKAAAGNDDHPGVIALSKLLNQLPLFPKEVRDAKFRNPNGVGMKLANFRRLDPEYSGKGLRGGGNLEKEVWETFAGDIELLKKTAESIKANYKYLEPGFFSSHEDEDEEGQEGRILTALHKRRERSKRLVHIKKRQAFVKFGKLECEACGFDFESKYGLIGKNVIECHHEIPISSMQEGAKTKLSDLRLVCSNCHRIIHRSKPWPLVAQLKANLQNFKDDANGI